MTALTLATITAATLGYSFNSSAAEKPKVAKVNAMNENNEETRSTLDDQQSVAVTIYNQDLALVKDTRKVNLKAGLI